VDLTGVGRGLVRTAAEPFAEEILILLQTLLPVHLALQVPLYASESPITDSELKAIAERAISMLSAHSAKLAGESSPGQCETLTDKLFQRLTARLQGVIGSGEDMLGNSPSLCSHHYQRLLAILHEIEHYEAGRDFRAFCTSVFSDDNGFHSHFERLRDELLHAIQRLSIR